MCLLLSATREQTEHLGLNPHRYDRRLDPLSDVRQLPRVSTDDFAAHTDPNILAQPHITVKKLKEMYNNTRKNFNPCYARKTGSESGTHAPWEDFCKSEVSTVGFRAEFVCEPVRY